VTIDADVATEVERIRKSEGSGFKRVMNDLLREGLKGRARGDAGSAWTSPIIPQDLGEALFDVSSVSRALDYAEGSEHR
jgi:hypothetical protein